jgi:hypothetical protein
MAEIFASNASSVGASAAAGISSQWPLQTDASPVPDSGNRKDHGFAHSKFPNGNQARTMPLSFR